MLILLFSITKTMIKNADYSSYKLFNIHHIYSIYGAHIISFLLNWGFIINMFYYSAARKFKRAIDKLRPSGLNYRVWCLSMIVSCVAYIKNLEGRSDSRLIIISIESALLTFEWGRSESVRIRFNDEAIGPSITNHFTEIIRMQMHRIDDVAGIFTAFSLASSSKDRAKKIS